MGKFALKFISGKYQGGEFPLPPEGELLVGRANDLDLVLVEDMVSRKHAKMVIEEGVLSVTDLGSTNGTFVNGEKIRRAEIGINDRILIGTSIIKVVPGETISVESSDPDYLREMMEDLADRAPETATMSGDLEEVPIPDILQLLATNKKSGLLTISGAHRGKIYINAGQLVTAMVGGEPSMKPMKALCRMVGWEAGAFHLEDWDATESFPDTFSESTESVLMEALRQHDELGNLETDMPEDDARLVLCVPMVPKLRDLSPGELDTLQLVLNFSPFKTIREKSEGTDHEFFSHIKKMLAEGYLEVDFE